MIIFRTSVGIMDRKYRCRRFNNLEEKHEHFLLDGVARDQTGAAAVLLALPNVSKPLARIQVLRTRIRATPVTLALTCHNSRPTRTKAADELRAFEWQSKLTAWATGGSCKPSV